MWILKKKFTYLIVCFVFFQNILFVCLLGSIYFIDSSNILTEKFSRITNDVSYKNDVWDITKYNTDPALLGSFPLYFFTSDGYILDRRSPIHGFLDLSDMRLLLQYERPQTITAITGQKRRVYAQAIRNNNEILGVIAVSYFAPLESQLEEIDAKLHKTTEELKKQVIIHKNTLDIKKVDERNVPYDVAFTIIDAYNTILKKTTNTNNFKRIPNFIDPSYLKPYITSPTIRLVKDNQNQRWYLLRSTPFYAQGKNRGVVILGTDIDHFLHIVIKAAILQSSISLILSLLVIFIVYTKSSMPKQKLVSMSVRFDEKNSILTIGEKNLTIPYATNQYYLLQALFAKPTKRWETDELLQRFGEEIDIKNSRKIYDAMIKINNKTKPYLEKKLILMQHKTYKLHPDISLSNF